MSTLLDRPPPIVRASVHGASSVVLRIGAVLGVLCVLVTVLAPVLGVRPLIFQSGSMAPAIPAGSLALARDTDAADIEVGDVVTVPAHGAYVTHRVIEVTHGPDRATLRLQGDGNKVPDADLYQVSSAPRTFASVPHLGSFVAWFSHAPGVYVLAGWVAVVLGMLRRRPEVSSGTVPPAQRTSQELLGPTVPARVRRPLRARVRAGAVTVLGPRPGAVLLGMGLVVPALSVGAWFAAPSGLPTPAPAGTASTDNEASASSSETSGATAPLVRCGGLGPETATLTWTPVTGATAYRLSYGPDGSKTRDFPPDTTSWTFSKDARGTFTIQAVLGASGSLSPASNSVDYETFGQGSCG